jgi:kynurenine formamidase
MPEVVQRDGREFAIYDLSDHLSNETSAFELNRHEIEYISAADMAATSAEVFGLGPEYWPEGQAYNIERVTLSTHAGTHLDAPHHYGPPKGGGKGRTSTRCRSRGASATACAST